MYMHVGKSTCIQCTPQQWNHTVYIQWHLYIKTTQGTIVVVGVQWNLYIKTTQGTNEKWSLKTGGLYKEVLYRT